MSAASMPLPWPFSFNSPALPCRSVRNLTRAWVAYVTTTVRVSPIQAPKSERSTYSVESIRDSFFHVDIVGRTYRARIELRQYETELVDVIDDFLPSCDETKRIECECD